MNMNIVRPLLIFLFTGLFEIGGGYLVWIWLRNDKPILYGLVGISLLAMYGAVATIQPSTFGRTYAAYGGIFIFLAIMWAWLVDGVVPDRYDLLGGLIAILGACIIFFAPRKMML